MGMVGSIREIKRQLWHRYGFQPIGLANGEPIFDSIPDGTYEVRIDGEDQQVAIEKNQIHILPRRQPRRR